MKLSIASIILSLSVISACGSGGSDTSNNGSASSVIDYSNVSAFKQSDLFDDDVISCINTALEQAERCTLAKLPLLGSTTSSPTIEDIMQRVFVSHSWMGERFETLLSTMPEEILPLFSSITAIVIDDDIIPSFYTLKTGAIYLDPRYLWTNQNEVADIVEREDFRSSFGSSIAFFDAFRYVKDNQYAYQSNRLSNNVETRLVEDLTIPLVRLISHELAHANDFVPPSVLTQLDENLNLIDALVALDADQTLSSQVNTDYALNSQALNELAQVFYFGQSATESQKQLTGTEAGNDFSIDGANGMYAYANQYEDFATLFEAIVMKHFYDIEMDTSFITYPNVSDDPLTHNDYLVDWGSRNRIANPVVQPRAERTARLLLPEYDWANFFNTGIGTETALKAGVSWTDNLDPLSNDSTKTIFNKTHPKITHPSELMHELRHPPLVYKKP